jgi:tetratricopeptide (TPR) repeat protein
MKAATLLRLAFAAYTCAYCTLVGRASASSVTELIESGERSERNNDFALAARRYSDALVLDPSSESAYAHLGALRLQSGDARESVRVFSVALARVPSFKAALVLRANAFWTLGSREEAERDLDLYLEYRPHDEAVLRQLAGFYGSHGRNVAQLAIWRRIQQEVAEPQALRDAEATVLALQMLVSEADPVAHPATQAPVRRTLARIAIRRRD